jgi:hypothetical protein
MHNELCDALALARHHYTDGGGPAGDLRFSYMDEWIDPSCTLVNQMPVSAATRSSAILYDSSDTWEGDQQTNADPVQAMFDNGHAVRVPAGTRVTIQESRNANLPAMGDGIGKECRVTFRGHDWWWLACAKLET